MVIFLLFCAIVTPFEIAFVNHEPSHKPISIINFVVDGSKCARTDGSKSALGSRPFRARLHHRLADELPDGLL